ncbi:MAG: bifunctional 2-polyprenyl-6-hydroxyphenol methylase/3-demethylubiquinol 3-O-methyltransferase UbiG [Alphaproteobacteria bacterium]|nr:bifunctional 2-polyprenyl-6-hydroxyphenol methylase/3-demethylubiquinol 3-O-methyltransferase UbiG [Alphaproteobacteria bacterium]
MTAKAKASATTIDPAEIERFAARAAEWWDPKGKFAPLHKLNPVRLAYIRECAAARFDRDAKALRPFAGLRLLDIGCGGGLLSEPMARMGFDVVAADAAEANVKTAMAHAADQGLDIDFRVSTAEEIASAGESFDVILNMEVIEHVSDVDLFFRTCASMIRPGGMMMMATLNRTMKAYALAVIGAEYVLGWLPRGTHDWRRFITPAEMRRLAGENGLKVKDLCGVSYFPLGDEWHRTADTGVNYMMCLERI